MAFEVKINDDKEPNKVYKQLGTLFLCVALCVETSNTRAIQ